jgi:Protein of unknown function (DUF3800)
MAGKARVVRHMSDRYVFADEAGNFDFSTNPGASRYFVLCTVTAEHCEIGNQLLALRRDLGWRGLHLDRVFHASHDAQDVRNEVFTLLADMDCSVDATVLEKRKAQPHLRDEASLYRMAWYLHFKYLARTMRSSDRVFVAASSLGTKKARGALHTAVDEVVRQLSPCRSHRVAFWPNESDPCLQVADYCTWAIQRKWERQDARSHELIAPKIRSEFDVWQPGEITYY